MTAMTAARGLPARAVPAHLERGRERVRSYEQRIEIGEIAGRRVGSMSATVLGPADGLV